MCFTNVVSWHVCVTQAAAGACLPPDDEQLVTAKLPSKNDAEESLQTAGKNGHLQNAEQLATREEETVNTHLGSSDETDLVDTSGGVDTRDSVFGGGSSADGFFEIEDSGVGDSCVNESDIISTSTALQEGRQKMTSPLASNGSAWVTAQSKIHEDRNATVSGVCARMMFVLREREPSLTFLDRVRNPDSSSCFPKPITGISEWDDSTKPRQYKRQLCL
jgi:hypothetical protein